MSDPVKIQLIMSLAGVAIAAIAAYFAYKANATSKQTHDAVNSRLTEFLEMAKTSYHAEGVAQERIANRERIAAENVGVIHEKAAEQVRQDNKSKETKI